MNVPAIVIGLGAAAATTVLAMAAPQQAPAAAPPAAPLGAVAGQQPQPTFRTGVELINLVVTVTDKRGRSVTDLTRDDFMVAEDGRVQEIVDFRSVKEAKDTPIGLGFMIDASQSMSTGGRLDNMRTAFQSIMGRMRKGDEFFVVEAASNVRVSQGWTTERNQALNAMRRIRNRTQPGSQLRNGVMAALDVSKTGTHKKQVLVVVTDGDPQGGDFSTVSTGDVAEAARASDVILYVLVLDNEEAGPGATSVGNGRVRQTALEWARISGATGGRTHYTQGFQQIEDAVDDLGREFSQQYEVSYQRAAADNRYHQIVVGVKRKEVNIRHRRGYLAAAPSQ